MTLWTPRSSPTYFTYDNWGANPSTTPGTSVTPGASNVEGTYTQVASGANIAQDVYGIYLACMGGATSLASKQQLLDIGVDNAGGSSYTTVITNLVMGDTAPIATFGNTEFFFPFYIKAGSSVAVRIQGSNATAGTVRVCTKFFGLRGWPETLPVGQFSETIGTNNSTSTGTAFTPGNAADGTWADLGATTNPMWWWQLGYQLDNTVITAEYTYIDLAYGDATNKVTIFRFMHGGTTGETIGRTLQTCLTSMAAYCPVPGGTHLYVRGRCLNAPDTGYNANVVGIGG